MILFVACKHPITMGVDADNKSLELWIPHFFGVCPSPTIGNGNALSEE